MKKYQLTEKLSTGSQDPDILAGTVSTYFFFRENDPLCWKLDAHIDYMLLNSITKMDLFLAQRETNAPHFFCKYFGEVGDKSEGGCGKICKGYEPRNGKSGACKHYGYTYEQTNRCFTLKLLEALISQNQSQQPRAKEASELKNH
jgi:hypothetical protein